MDSDTDSESAPTHEVGDFPPPTTTRTNKKVAATTPRKATVPHANQEKRAIEVLELADEEDEVSVVEKGLTDKDVHSVKGEGQGIGRKKVRYPLVLFLVHTNCDVLMC